MIADLAEEFGSIVTFGDREYRRTSAGTCYHISTPKSLCEFIDLRIGNKQVGVRVIVLCGDVATGRLWVDADRCYFGRSSGPCKIPLTIYRRNSIGGGGLLDHCVLAIAETGKPHCFRWTHPAHDAKALRAQFDELIATKQLYIRG